MQIAAERYEMMVGHMWGQRALSEFALCGRAVGTVAAECRMCVREADEVSCLHFESRECPSRGGMETVAMVWTVSSRPCTHVEVPSGEQLRREAMQFDRFAAGAIWRLLTGKLVTSLQ